MSERSAAEAALYQLTKDAVRVTDDDLGRVVAGEPLDDSGPRVDVSFPADGAEDLL
ncbi:hypothetical protein MWT96_25445 (plasmid) [Prescottella equi]|uniref:Uncharacterized protein n=1 Tax=Rhodococcus hoagii TaxID=43767 RepID=A0A1Z1UW63_RHOHA|nr:hypothetical protein [Prescottella equi]ARX59031.1 hypothetical protein pVAPA1357_0051 [Prescottella equi]ARX59081.1 hypothetical protein pVAPA1422_0051 [Prescottella equi]ARX59163.1 hypothetical protein pVAPA1340_0051 [Prescottella equi]ARX59258.1 hypothetical protein pVAPA1637_0051 [Prescottella equi]ARX59314.1 hypothetical protein pVAPA1643_0051 [Prescottella equi]